MLVNLHSHLEGRIRPATAAELGPQAGLPEPDGGWEQALTLDGPADLTVYLAKVAASYPFFGRYEWLRRIAYEAVLDAAAEGQDHYEVRFGPATHASPHFDIDDVVRAAIEGVREARRETGISAGLVVAALRHHAENTNLAVAQVAARYAGAGVVGFDLAGDELRFADLSRYEDAFGLARAAGLGLTCHAAEAAPGHAVRDAVERFGVTRIGHGAHLAEDPGTLAWAADHGVVVEICPTSNWYTGATKTVADHPAATFAAAGLPLVLGDDNPVQTGSPLASERAVLAGALGFSPADLAALDRTSVAAAFLDDGVREVLAARLS